jgi:2-oxoglutarate dehydrogenase E1 component
MEFESEEWESEKWELIKDPKTYGSHKNTGINVEHLREVGLKIARLPENKKFHNSLVKIFKNREKSIEDGVGIDWGTAEALAFATLIEDGNHVRLSGQDVERGTFSHRHAHVFYQDEDGCYVPINSVASQSDGTRTFIASNSHLSEYAVLGFEFGYAQTSPDTLCLWEAQFGDFANGAQIMIDQFIASAEQKWNVKNGLVMLLPHGYDGAGPEHSSCRIERYLQLCDADDLPPKEGVSEDQISQRMNMAVCYPTTAANYFHLLRR